MLVLQCLLALCIASSIDGAESPHRPSWTTLACSSTAMRQPSVHWRGLRTHRKEGTGGYCCFTDSPEAESRLLLCLPREPLGAGHGWRTTREAGEAEPEPNTLHAWSGAYAERQLSRVRRLEPCGRLRANANSDP